MTIRTALEQGAELLRRDGISEPRLTAEVLLGHAMHCERTYFYAHPEQELREVEWIHYGRYLDERLKGKPTQYITKSQEFYGRDFAVSRDVLIPRPETELLVESVLKRRPSGRIVDVGTGSGIIAITLALELKRDVVATDLSFEACEVARQNALRLGAPVQFLETDLLKPFANGSIEVIVCNPPYVPFADRATLQREVRDWEPSLALYGGPNGLAIYRRLIPEARRVLNRGCGLLALEIGFGQAEAVSAMLAGWTNLEILPDLAGIPRVVFCEA